MEVIILETYLDYSATTPVDKEILTKYINITKSYVGNVNSQHKYGKDAKKIYNNALIKICSYFNCNTDEIIFTSGSSESNSLAILGTFLKNNNNKNKHIIISKLEHKSILELADYLIKRKDITIDYVKLKKNGQVDLENLRDLINENTILVSICGVNSETGYKQDLEKINKVIKNKNKNTLFHSDLTQALGKTKFNLKDVDMASFSSHKIYSPKGIGILYKKKNVQLDKIIYGTTSLYKYRGGTPPLPLIVAFASAIEKAYKQLNKNIEKTKKLNNILKEELSKYNIRINSNEYSIPQIFNFSLLNIKGRDFVQEISKYGIYLSTTSACSSLVSNSILLKELTNDSKIYLTSIRVSISHLTTETEIRRFIYYFDKIINNK